MTTFYLEGEKLSAIRASKKRTYTLFCDECGREISGDEKVTYFEFAPISQNCGGGSFTSCEACLSSFMKDVKVEEE